MAAASGAPRKTDITDAIPERVRVLCSDEPIFILLPIKEEIPAPIRVSGPTSPFAAPVPTVKRVDINLEGAVLGLNLPPRLKYAAMTTCSPGPSASGARCVVIREDRRKRSAAGSSII